MLKSEIRTGGSYLIGGYAMGRAVVLSEPIRDPYRNRRYIIEVNYPDASPTIPESRRKLFVSANDFSREWNNEDQAKFERQQQTVEDQRGWQEELSIAGFSGTVLMNSDGTVLDVRFRGRVAERVLETLTGHTFPKEDEIIAESSA